MRQIYVAFQELIHTQFRLSDRLFYAMRIFIRILLFMCAITPVHAALATSPSIAFYYADNVPIEELSQFNQIVVDPDQISDDNIIKLKQFGGKVIAYVSVGESERWRDDYDLIDKDLFIGVNEGWNSDIMDLDRSEWQDFLLEQRFSQLAKRQFDGFFLDTLDSYQAVVEKDKWSQQEQGLIKLIRTVSQEFPAAKIILNRGFPILEEVHTLVHGVVAESLYAGWNPLENKFDIVKKNDRDWLLNKLQNIKEEYGLPISVVDYLPPSKRSEARQIAKKIAEHGFIPWVSTPELDYLGVGKLEVIPRKILMLYNSVNQYFGDMYFSSIHTAAAMPLEYLGYVPVYYNINEDLPEEIIKGRYAGIVTWFDGQAHNPNYNEWIYKQLNDGVKIAFMGGFGFNVDDEILIKLGLHRINKKVRHLKKVQFSDDFIGFESKPLIGNSINELYRSKDKSNNTVHLKVRYGDKEDQVFDPVITADWGGLAFSPWIRDIQTKGYKYWILDPFKFFKSALNLPDIPMPDVTTENGRRIWMAHIDGDGFLNRAEMRGTPYSAIIIKNEVLKKYNKYPHTVSIIEGEIGELGLYPQQSPVLKKIAKEIFMLDNVESASHTFSHPFKWLDIEENQKSGGDYNLPIKDYAFSFNREISGSIDFINKNLLPNNKKAKVFLWSGEASPTEEALKYSYDKGLLNMNGGNTTIRRDRASLLFVSPMARTAGEYVQVYAPIMNENVYTNNWTGPFYGFQRVIDTLKMTDKPRRLKPIDIYYHFYSGSKPAAMTALHKVYQWTLEEDIFPVYISEYSAKILEYRKIVLARDLDGSVSYSGTHHVKTLRTFSKNNNFSLNNTRNIIGYRKLHDAVYLSLGASTTSSIKKQNKKIEDIYLVQSNGRVMDWIKKDNSISVSFSSHLPLMIEVASQYKKCVLLGAKNIASKTSLGWRFNLTAKHISNVEINCQ